MAPKGGRKPCPSQDEVGWVGLLREAILRARAMRSPVYGPTVKSLTSSQCRRALRKHLAIQRGDHSAERTIFISLVPGTEKLQVSVHHHMHELLEADRWRPS